LQAEIIAVGTELLLGHIPNTNAQFMSQELAKVGVDVLFHTVVGDNEQRIADSIRRGLDRADVLMITGGIGPTHDDLTREAIAAATGRQLERDEEFGERLRKRFEQMGRRMPDMNLRQADVPSGAEMMPNPRGTAPGIYLDHEGKKIFAVPGVPSEMQHMMRVEVLPRLVAAAGSSVIASTIVKVSGLAESEVGEMLAPLIAELDAVRGVTLALLAGGGEIRVRLTAKAATDADAKSLIEPVETRVRETLGSSIYGIDDVSLEETVSQAMLRRGLTLAVAESITGGMICSRLVGVPGTSDYLLAGYVTYSPQSKVGDLKVPREIIEANGAVSEDTVIAMARGARERVAADIGLSTSGEAGPEPQEAPVGTVWLGLAWNGGEAARNFRIPSSDREVIRQRATMGALNFLRLWLLGEVA
jgi:nicotinamide-nucleotide amidase